MEMMSGQLHAAAALSPVPTGRRLRKMWRGEIKKRVAQGGPCSVNYAQCVELLRSILLAKVLAPTGNLTQKEGLIAWNSCTM
jgi:hypothetical protein